MRKSSLQLTIISILSVVVAIGLAAMLSSFTPQGNAVLPPDTSQSGSTTPDKVPPVGGASKPSPEPVKGGIQGGNPAAAQEGRLPGYESHDINTAPDQFCYLLNSTVEFAEPDAPGNIMVENTPGNLCPMQLCYYRSDTDELIYVSPMLKPGTHISTDTLTAKLKKGEYTVNAVLSVYDETTLELKTTFHEEVTLTVKEKFLGIF